ncbi:PIR protein [Plasmodium yoelii]|uniref:PIR protein n=2 Tax=Plasmodium yoelii TaxID=5861 RepID=A0AAE9X3G9_PLAYO|nr:PIR protein [Plasmodium yoelii]WBY61354.1 PIR protein [Plasmodium yoelii yoelii]VTZ82008.1 PIR protein [Plasmodium yoelii]|eukprot:XP_022810917.1 PIR protein [Plasmodium yoelii]
MNDELCGNFDFLRICLPDELGDTPTSELKNIQNYNKYCPNGDCNTELDQITIGFLWLLEQYFTKYPKKGRDGNNINPIFFIHITIWLSYKLNQKLGHNFTKISDFYTNSVDNSGKYSQFTKDAYTISGLDEFIEKQKDLLNMNIKDLSKFYDASKLICSMYGNFSKNINKNELLNNANEFVVKYQELDGESNNTTDSSFKQILSALSADYDNLRKKRNNITSLPEITADMSAYISRVTSSSSSIGNRLFTVLSIFGAIAFFLGISYKYSLFGFRKRFKKQQIREKIKNIKKKINQ